MKKLIRKIVLWAFRNIEIQTSLTHGGRITVIKEIENTATENSDVMKKKLMY